MKKVLLISVVAFTAFSFVCCNKDDVPVKAAIITSTSEEPVAEEEDAVQDLPPKTKGKVCVSNATGAMSQFLYAGELCGTMYVTATPSLKVREYPNFDAEKTDSLPTGAEVKVISLGDSVAVGYSSSYWVQVEYEKEDETTEKGWVYGGFLSQIPYSEDYDFRRKEVVENNYNYRSPVYLNEKYMELDRENTFADFNPTMTALGCYITPSEYEGTVYEKVMYSDCYKKESEKVGMFSKGDVAVINDVYRVDWNGEDEPASVWYKIHNLTKNLEGWIHCTCFDDMVSVFGNGIALDSENNLLYKRVNADVVVNDKGDIDIGFRPDCADLSHDGKKVIFMKWSKVVSYDVESREFTELFNIEGFTGQGNVTTEDVMACSADGKSVYAVVDSDLWKYDLSTGEGSRLGSFDDFSESFYGRVWEKDSLTVSPDEKTFYMHGRYEYDSKGPPCLFIYSTVTNSTTVYKPYEKSGQAHSTYVGNVRFAEDSTALAANSLGPSECAVFIPRGKKGVSQATIADKDIYDFDDSYFTQEENVYAFYNKRSNIIRKYAIKNYGYDSSLVSRYLPVPNLKFNYMKNARSNWNDVAAFVCEGNDAYDDKVYVSFVSLATLNPLFIYSFEKKDGNDYLKEIQWNGNTMVFFFSGEKTGSYMRVLDVTIAEKPIQTAYSPDLTLKENSCLSFVGEEDFNVFDREGNHYVSLELYPSGYYWMLCVDDEWESYPLGWISGRFDTKTLERNYVILKPAMEAGSYFYSDEHDLKRIREYFKGYPVANEANMKVGFGEGKAWEIVK